MVKRGIDISSHQGAIDLAALKSQIDFVIIRVGYGSNGTLDNMFRRNADLCVQLNIPFGFYWYSYALNTNEARLEAEHFLNAISPYKNKYSYGCWFDMEDADGYKRRYGMPSNQTLREICATFCKTVQDNGYYVGIYASASWFNNQLNGSEITPYDKWVAQWPTSGGRQTGLNTSSDSRNSSMWQFTSAGRFNGYNGNLDTNYAYYDYPSLIGNMVKPEPIPEPTPNYPTGTTLDLVYRTMLNEFGQGEERKNNLGPRYNEVQDFINHIYSASVDTLVQEVYNRKYGDGQIRKVVLGERYNEVQNKINSNENHNLRYYTVVSGDTLSGIGQKLGVDWHYIAQINNISSPYTIYPGQKLKY